MLYQACLLDADYSQNVVCDRLLFIEKRQLMECSFSRALPGFGSLCSADTTAPVEDDAIGSLRNYDIISVYP